MSFLGVFPGTIRVPGVSMCAIPQGACQRNSERIGVSPRALTGAPGPLRPEFTYEKKCTSEGKTALFLLAKHCVAIHASLVKGAIFPVERGTRTNDTVAQGRPHTTGGSAARTRHCQHPFDDHVDDCRVALRITRATRELSCT